jgi:hypothetical protein
MDDHSIGDGQVDDAFGSGVANKNLKFIVTAILRFLAIYRVYVMLA